MTYEVIRYDRKTMSLLIKADGRVIVKAPSYVSDRTIQEFVAPRREWIEKQVAAVLARHIDVEPTLTMEQVRQLTEAAKQDLPPRVARFAAKMGVTYGRITIGPQKAHWGYCSAKGDLRFNCMIMLCPEECRDYLVAHELCHRKVLNHLPPFWAELEKVMPDYAMHKKWLDDHCAAIIGRLP